MLFLVEWLSKSPHSFFIEEEQHIATMLRFIRIHRPSSNTSLERTNLSPIYFHVGHETYPYYCVKAVISNLKTDTPSASASAIRHYTSIKYGKPGDKVGLRLRTTDSLFRPYMPG